jgi:dTDP-4-amino-4,6-dideoxygalactose transaminase
VHSVVEKKVKLGKRIFLASPHMSDEGYEMEYIKEAFDTNWIAPLGKNVDEFEKEIAARVGVKHAAALTTGTAAIHLALKYLGVGHGDIVFCQSLTFSATANPIIYQNATPVFIDSDFETWNMCPKALEEAFKKYNQLNKLPKAVIVVHLYGLSADMDKIMEICNQYNVPVIEDAAESLGTTYKGKATGSFGKFGVFSFNGNKIITTSGGGMLVSDDEEAIKKVRFWATQSRDQARHYQHSEIGFNYRMSNVLAGIGRGQLKVLDQRIEKKKYIFEFYKKHLSDLPGVTFMPVNDWNNPNFWLSCLLINPPSSSHHSLLTSNLTKDTISQSLVTSNSVIEIIESLEKENIESRLIWKPMHLQPFFSDCDYIGTNVSQIIFENGLCLPSDTKMNDNMLDLIINNLKRVNYEKHSN